MSARADAPSRATTSPGGRPVRAALGVVGVAAGLYGAILLLGTGFENIVATVVWLVGGVVAHDAVLAPLTIVLAALALRVLPAAARAWFAAAAVVIATTTVVAVPVLLGLGAKDDNPTLLPRDYVSGWLVVVALVVLLTLAAALLTRVRARRAR